MYQVTGPQAETKVDMDPLIPESNKQDQIWTRLFIGP